MKITLSTVHPGHADHQVVGVAVKKDKTPLVEICEDLEKVLGTIDAGILNGKGKNILMNTVHEHGVGHVLFYAFEDASSREEWRNYAATVVRTALSLKQTTAIVHLPQEDSKRYIQSMCEGSVLASYSFNTYKSHPAPAFEELTLVVSDADKYEGIVSEYSILAEEVNHARDLVNESGSVLTPEKLAQYAKQRAFECGVECEVLDEEQIQGLGMGALYGVGRGSAQPPRLIVLRYHGDPDSEERLGLVGKGVTYDTGGYCLKPGGGMLHMNDDMGGAAAVISTVFAAARNHVKVNMTVVVGACENSIDQGGFKPSDVLRTMKGVTVEVINTDAEGRLTLADAVYYTVTKEKVTRLVDAATLTGSAIATFGPYYTASVSNDDAFYGELLKAAEVSGECFWRLPCDERYRALLDSRVADMKNLVGHEGGCIIAGMFIKEFTEDVPWIHLDLCGAYYTSKMDGYVTELASGQPVRTLYELAKHI